MFDVCQHPKLEPKTMVICRHVRSNILYIVAMIRKEETNSCGLKTTDELEIF